MKTTIDISDHLLNRARELARRENTTLKAITAIRRQTRRLRLCSIEGWTEQGGRT